MEKKLITFFSTGIRNAASEMVEPQLDEAIKMIEKGLRS